MTDKNRERLEALKDLRRRFSDIDFWAFQGIIETLADYDKLDDPALIQLLHEENERARQAGVALQEALAEMVAQIRVSEMHLRIQVVVPAGVDREHVQAILAYGIALPGSKGAFAGSRRLTIASIHRNVEHKLCERFAEDKFVKAWAFLFGNGVVVERNHSFSFDSALSRRGLTPAGRDIVDEMNRFLHEKK